MPEARLNPDPGGATRAASQPMTPWPAPAWSSPTSPRTTSSTTSATPPSRSARRKVILYDRDSASAFADPMPNQWASQAEGAQFSDPLSDQELVKLGREPFARKVAAAARPGSSAWGWLASDRHRRPGGLRPRPRRRPQSCSPTTSRGAWPGRAPQGRDRGEASVEEATETPAGPAVVLVASDGSTELAAGRLWPSA